MADTKKTDSYFEEFQEDNGKKGEILTRAALELSPVLLTALEKRIAGSEAKGKGKKKKKVTLTPDTSKKGGADEEEDSDEDGGSTLIEVSDSALDAFWAELETLDISALISEDVVKAFEYQGFNPNVLLKTLMVRGLTLKKPREQIQEDIVNLVTIAVLKGSITEKNLLKMSDEGKIAYAKFEKDYKLQKGGSKGKGSDHITVARVAASMPGIVMQVLKAKPTLSKLFPGPFGSTALPYYLRHQAAAACIPSTTPDRLKDFLLGLITAFTADQTKALSSAKTGSEELFDKQVSFVLTTHTSLHPSDDSRLKIFKKTFSIENDYEKIASVAAKIKKVKSDFVVLTLDLISEDLKNL